MLTSYFWSKYFCSFVFWYYDLLFLLICTTHRARLCMTRQALDSWRAKPLDHAPEPSLRVMHPNTLPPITNARRVRVPPTALSLITYNSITLVISRFSNISNYDTLPLRTRRLLAAATSSMAYQLYRYNRVLRRCYRRILVRLDSSDIQAFRDSSP